MSLRTNDTEMTGRLAGLVSRLQAVPVLMSSLRIFVGVCTAGVLSLGIARAQSFAIEPLWELPPGSRPYLTNTDNLQRGVAYNPITDRLILVSRLESTVLQTIRLLNAANGEDAGELISTGISGGTFVLSKIGVAEDGAIYAANFGTYSLSNPFKVYRWADESAVPTVAFFGDPGKGNNQQWGNALDVRGTGANTQILLPTRGTIAAVLTTANGTSFSSTVLTTDAPAGAFYHGVAFGPGNTFWGKTNSGPLREMRFDLAAGTATTIRTINPPDFPAAVSPIAVDPVNLLLAGIAIDEPDTVQLFDIAATNSPPVWLGSINTPADNPNTLFQGALDFYHGGRLFALNVNNGLSAFNIIPPSRLRLSLTTSNATLAWPLRFTNAVLQSAQDVTAGAGAWSTRVITPAIQGGERRATLPRADSTEYYRLQRIFRVMSYNIRHGLGADSVLDLNRTAGVIRSAGADIVGLQEVDRRTTRSGGVDQAAELGRLTGMYYFFGKNINYQGGEYGNAVLSRYPIRHQTHTLLQRVDTTLEQRGVNRAIIDLGGVEVVLLNTHLDHTAGDADRLHSIAQIKTMVQSYGARPVLICGDFNARPDSEPYAQMAVDFSDAWAVVGDGNGYTFSSTLPNRRIDYVWFTPERGLSPTRAWVPLTIASDHLPLVTEWLVPAQ
jgi:endonuclease/exonuclease/phosphatase family metal-dependent hydrolase